MAHRVRLDLRTDIYSLSAALYEMLTWRPPFEGKDYTDTLSRIIACHHAPLRSWNGRISKDLKTIVLKFL